MNYNGGKVATSHYEIEKSEGEYVPVWEAEWTLNSLLEVGEHFKWLNTAVNLSEEDEFYLPAWYRESALIGRGLDLPDEILLGLDGVRRGRIDIVYNLGDLHTTAPLKPHATTFPGFLSTLPAKRTYSE